MRSIRVAVPLILLLLGFFGLIACERETSKSANTASGSLDEVVDDWDKRNGPDPCKAANKLLALQNKYHNKNVDTDDENLNAQRRNNKYDIEIKADPTWGIVMHITGHIAVDGRPRKLRKLIEFIEKDLERGCVQRVTFDSMTASTSGFEWTICEDPEKPCPPPDGACGLCVIPKETPKTNTNSNANTNGSSNSNPGTSTNSSNSDLPKRDP